MTSHVPPSNANPKPAIERASVVTDPEHRRQLDYIARQLADDTREPADHAMLTRRRADIMRRYTPRGNPQTLHVPAQSPPNGHNLPSGEAFNPEGAAYRGE